MARAIRGALVASFAFITFLALANDKSTWVVQSFLTNNRIVHTKGLSGAGQVVTMADGSPDMSHQAFSDPNRPFNCADPNASVGSLHRKVEAWLDGGCDPNPACGTIHGTHDAGAIVGDAPSYGSWNGMDGHAFGARLIVVELGIGQCIPQDLIESVYQPSFDLGSRIISDGFGTTNEGEDYGVTAAQSDQFAWDNKDYLIVIPAGNGGSNTCIGSGATCGISADCPREVCVGGGGIEEGACQGSGQPCFTSNDCPNEQCGTYSKITAQAHAKNVITVGASLNGSSAQSVASFSSWGPTEDGRLKPTLLAPGDDICSSTVVQDPPGTSCLPGTDHYTLKDGTSFSHPAVSGSAALVRQYFMGGYYPSGTSGGSPALMPSSALMRAVMINGAVEMTDSSAYPTSSPATRYYPNPVQGWGRLHLDNALFFNGDQRNLVVCQDKAGFSASGASRLVPISVSGSTQPFEATLVWTDPPGDPNTPHAVQLVNNLNLRVTTPGGGTTYKGNVFNVGSGTHQSATGGTADAVNVEEGVLRNSPATGTWNVYVDGTTIDTPSQPFALAVTGQVSLLAGAYVDAAADHQVGPGTHFSGNYTHTWTSDNSRQVLRESSGPSGGLKKTWRFDNVPCTSTRHILHVEGFRQNNSDGDNFQFYYSTDDVNYTLIPGAVINQAMEAPNGFDYVFDDAGLMGTVYIQVRDTVAGGGSSLDKVNIDNLEIRY